MGHGQWGRWWVLLAWGVAMPLWAADARPFALAWRDGWLFHGVVNAREDGGLGGELAGYVYRSRPDGSDMTLAGTVIGLALWADSPQASVPY